MSEHCVVCKFPVMSVLHGDPGEYYLSDGTIWKMDVVLDEDDILKVDDENNFQPSGFFFYLGGS